MPELELDSDSSAIWHLLVDNDKATPEQLREAYLERERTGKAFTTVLYNYGVIRESELLELVAQSIGSEVVDIKSFDVPRELVDRVGYSVARMYRVVPLYEDDGVLVLAARDAMNYRMQDELHYVLDQECRIVVASPTDIDEALDHFYPEEQEMASVGAVLDELAEQDFGDVADVGEAAEELEEMAKNAPIIRFVDVVLYQAVKERASDIHFEPFADEFRIRYRVDGALYEMSPPPKHLALPVISRIKVISKLNIAERRRPQDGRIELRIAGRPVDLRVSTLPTQYGESVVLRVLDRSVVNLDLDTLGIEEEMLEDIRELIRRPNGIIIVTGPTGSGKTTTLYSALRELNRIEDKLLTLEDPVEYDLEGIMQVQINPAVEMTFANGLRAFLRQDPDRIMVGEMRDLETAMMAVQASLTGHLVMTTLHTNDSAGAVTRLLDMGVAPFRISSTLAGVLGQRLIRRICPRCRAEYRPDDDELKLLGMDRDDIGDRPFYYGKGCEECNGGYSGRVGIFELLKVSPEIAEMINQSLPTGQIREKAVEQGMRTMRDAGLRTILDGVSSVEEVLTYT
mgnify:CR=1 FL=1